MKISISFLFILVFLYLNPIYSYGQSNGSDIENTKISILTCRKGNELYSTFGHTAIRIYNRNSNFDIVYNYGLFSFDTPNFYPKFMRGQLPYFLGATEMKYFLRDYKYDRRSVFEQELNLNNDQKQIIIEYLIDNSKPENREYKYDFFYDNCATRVVDVFSLAGNISYDYQVEKKTFRDLLKENLQNLVWSDFGIDLVIGARADQMTTRRHQMFLPQYVMENLATASLDSKEPLAKEANLILDFESLNETRMKKATNWPLIFTIGIFLITLLLNTKVRKGTRFYNKALLILSALFGLFLIFMWFGTNHGATRDNWNIMWLNPLIIIYLVTKEKVKKVIFYLLLAFLIVSGLNSIYTFLPQFFNIAFLPLIASLAVILFKEQFVDQKPMPVA